MGEKNYSQERMIKDFSLDEMVDAMERALTQPVSAREISMGEGMLLLSGNFAIGKQGMGSVKTEVWIDETQGELVQTFCECGNFANGYYSCEHTGALLAHYLLQREEKEALQKSPIFSELKERTGVEDPFLPGILRRTDQALKPFLRVTKKGVKNPDQPRWIQEEGKTGAEPISLEVILNVKQNELTVEFKAGPRKHYVIRDLQQFSKAYQENKAYDFSGNVRCPVGRNHFVKQDQKVMDLISGLCVKEKKGILGYALYQSSTKDFHREIRLARADLDTFLELLNGRQVLLSFQFLEAIRCRVAFDQVPSAYRLSKTEYGAILEGEKQTPLFCGREWMYLCQDQKILRLPENQWEQRRLLNSALELEEQLYIQEKDLPAVCEGLKELGTEIGQIQVQGMELEAYIPEEPKIRLYLDHPQENMITCEVKAHYPRRDSTYNVCDQTKDKRKRNILSEQMAGEEIWDYFTAYDESNRQMCLECDDGILYRFLTETIPILSEKGEVFISENLKKLRVRPAGEMSVGLQVDSGNLMMSLHSNEMSKEEMIEVLSSYQSRRKFTRLKNGEFVIFSQEDDKLWETMAETYRNYGKQNPEAMKVPLFRALYLEESLRDREDEQTRRGEQYLSLIRELNKEDGMDYSVPDSLKEVLRPYQKDGFCWMKMLKKNGFGGILADDMGLGKTLQILTFLLSEKEEQKEEKKPGKTLIVAPASLIYNWKKEVEHFTPQLSCQIIAGSAAQRKNMIGQIPEGEADLYVTSYDLLKRDILLYEGIPFENQFIDEAQYIKNQNTQVAKAVRLVNSRFRMALTGTPIENRLSELWSIFDYLMPGFLYGYSRFRTDFETPVINEHDETVLSKLRSMVHPFILRRLKKEVLKDLPDKLEETITVNLQGEQRKLYDAYAERLRLSLDKQSDEEFHQKKLEILAELTRLRQICCGPECFLEGYQGENAKKEACLELIRQAIDGEHKVLLFSQFTSVLDHLGKALEEEGITYHRIDGSVSKELRMQQVEAFAEDEVPVFLISLKAGGTGLNLTAADIVIHYDPWWNLAAQNQATDRTHRIGQENTVTVYQIIAEKTVEEQITNLQKLKAQLAEDILSGEGIASIMIDKNELMGLLR